jgi:hypothetical protein
MSVNDLTYNPGPMLLFLKLAKILAFLTQNKASFYKNCDRNIGFWEKRHFVAEKWHKSQKIVIITSTPGVGKYFQNISTFHKTSQKL